MSSPDGFRSPKRAKTLPLAEYDKAGKSNDIAATLKHRTTALGPESASSLVRNLTSDPDDGEENFSAASSAIAAETRLLLQDSFTPACHDHAQSSSHEQNHPGEPAVDNGEAARSPASILEVQEAIGDSVYDPENLLITKADPPHRQDSSGGQASVTPLDENIGSTGNASSPPSSTGDSDSIYEHLDEFDADELASILGDPSRPTVSEDEFCLVQNPPHLEQAHREEKMSPWSAPLEPLRPPNPYHKGQSLQIQKHKAPPPFGPDYADYPGLRERTKERDLRTKTLVEICMENPPMEGEITSDSSLRTLHILEEIRVSEDGGAQLVVCRLDNESDAYAAKIYDPLYYGFSDRMWSDMPRDVASEADKDYCREAAAYLEVDEQFGGKETPKFYGSWTFRMPIDLPDGRKVRHVRMILMEQIQGNTMSELSPPPYPEDICLEALAQTLETFNRLHAAGVIHRDIAQRNVMICDGGTTAKINRVVIIDFNFAVVSRLAEWNKRSRRQPLPEKPRNPIDDWWDCGALYDEFGDWLPVSWDRLYKPLREWLYARWGKSTEFLPHKEPLIWDNGK